MNTLIIYMSKHGCTEKATDLIKQNLNPHQIEIINLRKEKLTDLDKYDNVIIGSSIHAGQNQKKIKNFCLNQMEILLNKKLGLFISCMEKGETAQTQLENAYPKDLMDHAIICDFFGGEFNFEKMNFIEKAIVKKIAHVEESISTVDKRKIKSFSEKFL